MIAILLGATSMAGAAFAATIYTDHALWLAAVGTVTMDTFEENGAAGFTSYGSTHNGADFTITGTNLYTVDPAYFSYYNWNSGDILDFESSPGSIVASGDFGFNYGNPAELFGTGIVTVDGSTYNLIGLADLQLFRHHLRHRRGCDQLQRRLRHRRQFLGCRRSRAGQLGDADRRLRSDRRRDAPPPGACRCLKLAA